MRLLGSALRFGTQPRLALDAPLTVASRVWPTDLNIGLHMDNVRYLHLMNRARIELFLRTGIARVAMRRRLGIPVANCAMDYRRSLQPWERFFLRTRIIGWSDRRFYVTQEFLRGETVVACGQLRCAFSGATGTVAPAAVFAEVAGAEPLSPPRRCPRNCLTSAAGKASPTSCAALLQRTVRTSFRFSGLACY